MLETEKSLAEESLFDAEGFINLEPPLTAKTTSLAPKERIKILAYKPTYPPEFICETEDGKMLRLDEDQFNERYGIDDKQKFDLFSQSELEEFQNLLDLEEKKIEEGLAEVKKVRRISLGGSQKFVGIHPAEKTIDPVLDSAPQRIRNYEKLLEKIAKARIRLKYDRYGICSVCENTISRKRLKAFPATDKCTSCKEEINNNIISSHSPRRKKRR